MPILLENISTRRRQNGLFESVIGILLTGLANYTIITVNTHNKYV